MITLQTVLEATGGRASCEEALEFSGVTTDSRAVRPGNLFVALTGEKFDGHAYCEVAVAQGASAVVIDKPVAALALGAVTIRVDNTLAAYQQIAKAYRLAQKNLRVVAVTGSTGKTSTKDLIAACLATKFKVVKTEANFNNEIGLPKTLLSLTPATEIAVVEMGMRGLGQIRQLKALAEPDAVVITNVGETHLELLGSLENIAKAKSEILEGLTAANFAVLNLDDHRVAQMTTAAQVVGFGTTGGETICAREIVTGGTGTSFVYESQLTKTTQKITMPLIGVHNVMNALAAIGVAEKWGVEPAAIRQALAEVSLSGARQAITTCGKITLINDAYNASPASMAAALQTLAQVKATRGDGARTLAVLADMLELGAGEKAAHARVGALAASSGVDILLGYGELTQATLEAAQAAGLPRVIYCRDKEEAAAKLQAVAVDGDIILFKGSHSMAVEQVITLAFGNKQVGDRI
ncbi:MAG: UDP-N-acetylmuramoyl-tripeptide--D-alanyl-D-alanine ligase [Acidaminococcaceae bacterium]